MSGRETTLSVTDLWTPPPAMLPEVAQSWREFYRAGLSGRKGYVITPADYRLLYVAQKGRCWICRIAKGVHPDDPKGRGSRRLGVDHDHLTGQVRGLLCTGSTSANTCNRLIDRYTQEALQRAADYKRIPPARVLEEMRRVMGATDEAGVEWSQVDTDRLAQSFLWAGDRDTA
jgi:hypothetical protein